MAYGITETGFVRPSFEEIRAEKIQEYQNAFGADIDITESSVYGQFINNQSLKEAYFWEVLESIYDSFNPDSAFGTALDALGQFVVVSRLGATKTKLEAEIIYGPVGTNIPLNHIVGQESGYNFKSASAFTITNMKAADVYVEIPAAVEIATAYSVTINGTEYSYTATGSDTKETVLQELEEAIDARSDVEAEVSGNSLRIYDLEGGLVPFSVELSANLAFKEVGTPAVYYAADFGNIPAPVKTVNVMVQTVGTCRCDNLLAGISGREVETDDQYRKRRRETVMALGKGTDTAIQARLLNNVVGVLYARVYSNRTSGVVDDMPAKSFESIVIGGEDDAIAETIWDAMPSGIEPYGTTEVEITDSNGDPQTIKFSRPENIYIWVSVEITESDEAIFPTDGANIVKGLIMEWAAGNLNVGTDVGWQKLFKPIYECSGIASVNLGLAATSDLTPPEQYLSTNIPITKKQIALFDTSRITVTVVA